MREHGRSQDVLVKPEHIRTRQFREPFCKADLAEFHGLEDDELFLTQCWDYWPFDIAIDEHHMDMKSSRGSAEHHRLPRYGVVGSGHAAHMRIVVEIAPSRYEGHGRFACCPAHEERTPSLSVRDTQNGKVLAHCHSGCSQEAVIAALQNLSLWETREPEPVSVAEYNYVNASGKLLHQVCRSDPKGFFQRPPDGHGGWLKRRVLSDLPAILENQIIF
jgi:hypothetical protein